MTKKLHKIIVLLLGLGKVGKSTLINKIFGFNKAKTSNGDKSTTKKFIKYETKLHPLVFMIHHP